MSILFFFFNDTATTEIYTLSLHDALPICIAPTTRASAAATAAPGSASCCERSWICSSPWRAGSGQPSRSEEHTSELQSRQYLVCRLLLEKKTLHYIRTTAPNSICVHTYTK